MQNAPRMLDRRLAATFALGFSSGLPLALSSGTLTYWLAASDVDKASVGAFALVELPYTYKFLVAPVLDHVAAPVLGRSLGMRRGWLLLTQLGLAAAIFATGRTDPVHAPLGTAIAALCIAIFSAAQDVVVDAMRIESFAPAEQGYGAVANTWGYRLGMLVSGAGALFLSTTLSWRGIYTTMAALVGLGMLAVLLVGEPKHPRPVREGSVADAIGGAVVAPLREFVARDGAFLVLAFLAIFRLGDALAGKMQNSFLVESGYTAAEIAKVTKLYGVVATVAGGAIAGVLLARRPAQKLLPFAAFIMLASNLAFAWLATKGHDVAALLAAIVIENGTSGIGGTITIVYLSELCSREHTATQYALLTSILSFSRTTLAAGSGVLAVRMGDVIDVVRGFVPVPNAWFLYFVVTTLAGLPGLALAIRLAQRTFAAPPEPIEDASLRAST